MFKAKASREGRAKIRFQIGLTPKTILCPSLPLPVDSCKKGLSLEMRQDTTHRTECKGTERKEMTREGTAPKHFKESYFVVVFCPPYFST